MELYYRKYLDKKRTRDRKHACNLFYSPKPFQTRSTYRKDDGIRCEMSLIRIGNLRRGSCKTVRTCLYWIVDQTSGRARSPASKGEVRGKRITPSAKSPFSVKDRGNGPHAPMCCQGPFETGAILVSDDQYGPGRSLDTARGFGTCAVLRLILQGNIEIHFIKYKNYENETL